MNTGKKKCEVLKMIRKQIAESNGIVYETSDCGFEGECRGTCPKCDAELSYLTKEIERLKSEGKEVRLDGICFDKESYKVSRKGGRLKNAVIGVGMATAMAFSMASCDPFDDEPGEEGDIDIIYVATKPVIDSLNNVNNWNLAYKYETLPLTDEVQSYLDKNKVVMKDSINNYYSSFVETVIVVDEEGSIIEVIPFRGNKKYYDDVVNLYKGLPKMSPKIVDGKAVKHIYIGEYLFDSRDITTIPVIDSLNSANEWNLSNAYKSLPMTDEVKSYLDKNKIEVTDSITNYNSSYVEAVIVADEEGTVIEVIPTSGNTKYYDRIIKLYKGLPKLEPKMTDDRAVKFAYVDKYSLDE